MIRRSLSILFWFLFFFVLALFVGVVGAFETWRQGPVNSTLETEVLHGPREPIVIDFSRAMHEESLTGKITLSPMIPFHTEWHDFGKRLVIVPESNWTLDAHYQLIIGSGRTSFFAPTPAFAFTVSGPAVPQIVSITPAADATDVALGVEDPVRIEFDHSMRDFFVDILFDPPVSVVYQNNPEKTVFEILPSEELKALTRYQLSVQIRWRGENDGLYHSLAETTFTTLPPRPIGINRDYAARVAEAKRFTRAKRSVGKYIDINLASQVMTLFEDGRPLDAYMISSGKRGMDTPKGDFAIENKAARPWSKQYGLYMPYWQAITPDGKYGIHELPEWPGGYKEGANHLGIPVSHGCMRLGIGPAKRVYEWTDIGTPVIIY